MTKVLLATDADWLRDEVAAALADADTTVLRVHKGADVLPTAEAELPDLVVLDLQIGNMGGMATCQALRHAQEAGELDDMSVLLLLDRDVDVFLARQAEADGWMIKPIDAFRLRRAATAMLSGSVWQEGLPPEESDEGDAEEADAAEVEAEAS